MRTLTIKRKKSFVACLGVFKVYVEDHNNSELVINDVPCRKLGTLKNGQEVTFQIDDEQVKIFVIADSASKSYCNDMYVVDAGTEDVSLEGICHFNPFIGNPFRFANNTSEEARANRKKSGKVGAIIVIVAIVVGFAIGFVGVLGLF